MSVRKHKVFISYHHDDQEEVEKFIKTFDQEHDIFISRALGVGMEEDIINSNNTQYVMQRIRDLYLKDSTVTIVMIGKCTWARRYVDWEIQSSLMQGESHIPNGLLGIKLLSYSRNGYPDRLNKNLCSRDKKENDCYARVINYPKDKDTLTYWIEDTFLARTKRSSYIVNPQERMKYNKKC
jgi:hypothetical protein